MPDFALGILAVFGLPPGAAPLADWRNMPGSWQYRWFQRRGWYSRPHPLPCSTVDAVGVFWPGIEAFAYRGECPQESDLPRETLENVTAFSSGNANANKMITPPD